MDNDRNFGNDRPMFKGDWHCGTCNAPITELPFEPDPARASSLLCKNCYRDKKNSSGGGFRR